MYEYNQIIEYIDGTHDSVFDEAQNWANEHGTTFEEDLSMRDWPKRYFVIGPEPVTVPVEEDVKATRRSAYIAEVDPMMSEYNRKKLFNLFEEGEEEALLKSIQDKVAEIKESYPYPVVVESKEIPADEISESPVAVSAEDEEEDLM